MRVEKRYGKKLIQAALAIRMPSGARDDEDRPLHAVQPDWFRLDGHVESLYARYADRLGDNAFAVLCKISRR